MSWLKKYKHYVIFIFTSFVSGFAAATVFWLLFNQTQADRELHPQQVAIRVPGILGGELLPQPKKLSTLGSPVTSILKTPRKQSLSETVGKLEPKAVRNSPLPGVVENPPMPGVVENPPMAGIIKNPPMPEIAGGDFSYRTIK
jgi:hypothetical protein